MRAPVVYTPCLPSDFVEGGFGVNRIRRSAKSTEMVGGGKKKIPNSKKSTIFFVYLLILGTEFGVTQVCPSHAYEGGWGEEAARTGGKAPIPVLVDVRFSG